jgi:hypothetical protein
MEHNSLLGTSCHNNSGGGDAIAKTKPSSFFTSLDNMLRMANRAVQSGELSW